LQPPTGFSPRPRTPASPSLVVDPNESPKLENNCDISLPTPFGEPPVGSAVVRQHSASFSPRNDGSAYSSTSEVRVEFIEDHPDQSAQGV
jgi:hypothetical protein